MAVLRVCPVCLPKIGASTVIVALKPYLFKGVFSPRDKNEVSTEIYVLASSPEKALEIADKKYDMLGAKLINQYSIEAFGGDMLIQKAEPWQHLFIHEKRGEK